MSRNSSGVSRVPLWEKVAQAIRNDIEAGHWSEVLPGEHVLANHYEVGRRTIRDALSQLEKEGRIGTSQGKPRQILSEKKENPTLAETPKHLLVLSPYAEDQGISKSRFVFNRMLQELPKLGIHPITRRVDSKSDHIIDKTLTQLKKQFPASVWLLHDCSASIQRWCREKDEKALILGPRDESVSYTSVSMDANAVISHALNQFEASGHVLSDIMLVMRRDTGKITRQVIEIFENLVTENDKGATVQILEHNDSELTDSLRSELSKSNPPTGLLCWRTHDAIKTVTFLTNQGIRLPESLSVISCGSSPTMEFICPNITRYLSPTADYERCFTRLLNQLLAGELRNGKEYTFIPEFLRGETVSTPPKKL